MIQLTAHMRILVAVEPAEISPSPGGRVVELRIGKEALEKAIREVRRLR